MRPDQDYTREYPSHMPAKITVRLKDGMVRTRTVQGFPGLPSHPFTWQDAVDKFDQLVDERLDHSLSDEIKHAVQSLETILYRTFLVRSAWISAGRTVVIQAEVPVRCGAANGCRLTG